MVVGDRGSAVVTVEHDGDQLRCTGIERLPFDLSAAALAVRALAYLPGIRFVIDSEGLGTALWAVVRPKDDDDPDAEARWTLSEGHGRDRQALVDVLLVAIEENRFRFAPGLPEMDAMSKALTGYRRQVKEDGLIGSELVVALLLAMTAPADVGVPEFIRL